MVGGNVSYICFFLCTIDSKTSVFNNFHKNVLYIHLNYNFVGHTFSKDVKTITNINSLLTVQVTSSCNAEECGVGL